MNSSRTVEPVKEESERGGEGERCQTTLRIADMIYRGESRHVRCWFGLVSVFSGDLDRKCRQTVAGVASHSVCLGLGRGDTFIFNVLCFVVIGLGYV